jgi:hypothetical protein
MGSGAAWLQCHFMALEVSAPQNTLGEVGLLFADVTVLIGLWFGVNPIVIRFTHMFVTLGVGPPKVNDDKELYITSIIWCPFWSFKSRKVLISVLS